MKTIRIFGTRSLILAAALGVSLGFTSLALADVIVNPDGKVTYLGTLGGAYSAAEDINDSGQVVGSSPTADGIDGFLHAFITGPNGMGMTDLGTLGGTYSYAAGINDSGQVVGSSATADGSQHAFITGPNGKGMTDLGTLGGSSHASGINDAGQVAGYSYTLAQDRGPIHVFITGPNGMGMTDLGGLGGSSSYATGINNTGQVTGYSDFGDPFLTGPNGMGIIDLSTLGGNSRPYGINDSGQVVGSFHTPGDDNPHAFITGPNGKGITDLGRGFATGVNDTGQVVGTGIRAGYYGFITGPNGMGVTDLNSMVDLPGEALLRPKGINNLGQVIADVNVIPEPASYALMLAGLGLVGFMVKRKKLPGNTVARG